MPKLFLPARRIRPKQGSLKQTIEIAGFDVLWRQSARRTRSLALKLDKTGQLIVMSPLKTSESEIRRFVSSRQSWIHRQLARHASMTSQLDQARGKTIPFLGVPLELLPVQGPRVKYEHNDDSLTIVSRKANPEPEYLDRRAVAWLREQSEKILPQRLQALSLSTGLQGSGLQIKCYRARWGSCRHDGSIQLNWKLVMAPPAVIDYVIVHELSHLKHFNHSVTFWSLVEKHCPDYRTQRAWLKQHGNLLVSRS